MTDSHLPSNGQQTKPEQQSKPTMRRKRGWMSMLVTDVEEESHDTKTFVFHDQEDGARAFDYIAGQYLTFRYDGLKDKPIVRSYTMSSSPSQQEGVRVTVKRVEGGLISNWMCDNLRPGSVLKARGPIGRFVFEPYKDHKRLIMVGAGSGVTPFVSIAREHAPHLGKVGHPDELHLIFSYRSRADLICWRDLDPIRLLPGVKITATLSREDVEGFEHGRIDAVMLDKALAYLSPEEKRSSTYMTCGPEALMDMVTSEMAAQGVASEHLKTESFES